MIPPFRRILDSEINDEKSCGFEIDLNGNLNVHIIENGGLVRLRNHIGEIKTLFSKQYQDLIAEFKCLIDFSFKWYTYTSGASANEIYFEVCLT